MILPLDGVNMTYYYMAWHGFLPIVVCYGHISYMSKTHSYQMKPSNIKHNKYCIYIYT